MAEESGEDVIIIAVGAVALVLFIAAGSFGVVADTIGTTCGNLWSRGVHGLLYSGEVLSLLGVAFGAPMVYFKLKSDPTRRSRRLGNSRSSVDWGLIVATVLVVLGIVFALIGRRLASEFTMQCVSGLLPNIF